jgi:putative flippase GtrA
MVVAIAFPIDIGLLYVFTDHLHMHYIISATLAFIISMVVNFFLSILWVFTNRTKRALWKELVIFSAIGFIGLGLTDLIIWLATSVFDVHYMISKLIAVSIVFFWSFGARRLTFKKSIRTIFFPKLFPPDSPS